MGRCSTHDAAHPFPWQPVLMVMLVQMCEAVSVYTMILLTPFITEDLLPHIPATKLGYYTGYVGSLPFAGSIFAGPFWGCVSDRVGRRPVLLTGMPPLDVRYTL